MTDEVAVQETNAENLSETSSYEDLFLNDTEEELSEETTEEANSEAEEEKPQEQGEEEQSEAQTGGTEETLELKFLGQTTNIPKEGVEKVAKALGKEPGEVVSLIQMGMNYNNTPEKKLLARFAKANGSSYEDYIKTLEANVKDVETEFMGSKIRQEHPDWDDEKVAMQIELEKRDKEKSRAEEERAARFELDKPILEFINKYPDVKEFPESVREDINKGIHPIIAYESYIQKQEYETKISKLNTELAKAQKNKENQQKTAGSLKDMDESGNERDWFLEGLGKY